MTFITVRELHDRTSEILRAAAAEKTVFVTRNGKPVAAIRGLTEEDLEDLVMLHDPTFRKGLDEAFADLEAGRVVSLDDAIAMTEAQGEGTANG
ncbi:MAG: type II toxin-antitoxin system prevent-host-death family antitoxin [Candidatus Bipolaricaulota bacterium]